MLRRVALDLSSIRGRPEDVPRSVPIVDHVPLVLQEAQHATHRRIARWIREIFQHFSHGGAPTPEEDIHDLALATAEICECVSQVFSGGDANALALCQYTSTDHETASRAGW